MARRKQTEKHLPLDHEQRRLVVSELDTTMLVEAAAGTGKTTCMIDRMVALLREGKCSIETMAAVTFTRKTAAELRSRFQVALEQETRAAEGLARQQLKSALDSVDRCFIGTIHSFCARLLRERPVEAEVDLAFQELDEQVDLGLRQKAWEYYVAALFARDDPILRELDELGVTGLLTKADTILAELNELGLDVHQLADMFTQFASFPDVDEWPAEKVELPDLAPVLTQVEQYLQHMDTLAPSFPLDRGNDKLMNVYERLPRLYRHVNVHRVAEVMNFLAQFRPVNVVQKMWPGGKQQAKPEKDRWENFARTVDPLIACWLEKRYEAVIRAIRPAVEVYNRLRLQAGGLNFQDLLLRAAMLLKDKPTIRQYFRDRFTHLLVDEFQDTDPIQAEVMLLLTADDPSQTRWRKCRPVPGSLFLVGDPKQSIYRFRRADIVTYEQVKEIITQNDGQVVPLTANFRSRPELVNWCNKTFENVFPAAATKYEPAACPMLVAQSERSDGQIVGINTVRVPAQCATNAQAVEFEAGQIARTIRHWLDTGATIPRTSKEIKDDITPRVTPGDFLIITWRKKTLSLFAQKLQELGIPHQVTGSSALGNVSEASLLSQCLSAVIEPDNPVALVAVLRGELFGISDPDLYSFKLTGGRFDYRTEVPANLDPSAAVQIREAFEHLQRHDRWLRRLPPVPAFERIAADLGLTMRALSSVGANERVGCMAKIFETLRSAQSQLHSGADLAELVKELVNGDVEFDGLPARPHETSAVRLMNLHKVKGLEAPVVFLAGAAGQFDHDVDLHIDRSGEKVRGYAAIRGPRQEWGKGLLLARPK
jgi:ATP-dependent helicase/nuclease subunit A